MQVTETDLTAPTSVLPSTASSSTATVADPALTNVLGGQSISGTEGVNNSSVLLATFTDLGNPTGNLTLEPSGTSYVADINWGDGTGNMPNSGTITYNSGTHLFEVRGSHTYVADGNYTISVQLHHEDDISRRGDR